MDPQSSAARKLSIRLRQSPDLLKTHPAPSEFPLFPPSPHVKLHRDDAASKILLAIGRSFMSVDNKAMTIKDLSEMVMNMGYACQNVSAASQAITTFIRSHLQRCEAQLDSPLLLKHTLSGTPADDDLLPALYSTFGGAASLSPEPRATNFRRGTVVWYLSRATGAQCPFSRVGIRLSDYVNLGGGSHYVKKREKPEQCGQKRKRRSTRECVLKHSAEEPLRPVSPLSSVPDSDSGTSDDDDEQPPSTKIKLTLKLPPLARVRQEAALTQRIPVAYRRSPSVPLSVAASPPPSSEDEEEEEDQDSSDSNDDSDDGGWLTMDVDNDEPAEGDVLPEKLDDEENQFSDEWDDDNDEELSTTTWESPGPRSPSVQPPAFRVKEEPRDVQGLLDQWEYEDRLVKSEDPLYPDWESGYHTSSPSSASSPILPRIKREDDFELSLSFSGPAFTDFRHSSPFGIGFNDESDVFPVSPDVFPVSPTSPTVTPLRPRASTVFSLSLSSPEISSLASDPLNTHSLSSLVHSLSMNSPTVSYSPHALFGPQVTDSLPSEEEEAASELCAAEEPACVSPNAIRIGHELEGLVVNTCEPCVPQIFATHIEGIAVYQSSLGSHALLRRIDTDFVNLTPVMKYVHSPQIMSAVPGATVVQKGKEEVRGLWVPVEAARRYVKDSFSSRSSSTSPELVAVLDVFLSDALVERFPTALREFVRTTRDKGPLMRQFGKNFGTDDIPVAPLDVEPPNPTLMAAAAAKERVLVDDQPPSPSFSVGLSMVPPVDVPLSATEEKIFDEFCVNLEWEKDGNRDKVEIEETLRTALPPLRTSTKPHSRARRVSLSPPVSPLSSCPPSPVLDDKTSTSAPSPPLSTQTGTSSTLRRSKRVADALAAKSGMKTRSGNRGSRNVS